MRREPVYEPWRRDLQHPEVAFERRGGSFLLEGSSSGRICPFRILFFRVQEGENPMTLLKEPLNSFLRRALRYGKIIPLSSSDLFFGSLVLWLASSAPKAK